MLYAKQASKRKRRRKTIPVLGAAGLSLSLASSASGGPEVDIHMRNTAVSHEITLGEEEISDVSLATFYVFDKENAGTFQRGVRQTTRRLYLLLAWYCNSSTKPESAGWEAELGCEAPTKMRARLHRLTVERRFGPMGPAAL